MSDYNTTIGVQIYDDFAKLQSELPKLISKLESIKMTLGDISNIKISSQGLSNISKQLSKIVNLDSLSNDLNKLNSTLDKLNIGNLKAMREEIAKLKQEYSNYINTMNRATGNKIKTSNIANTVKNSNYLSEGLNDIKGTRSQNITSYIRQMNNGLSDVDKTAQRTKKSITSMFSLGKVYWFLNYTKQAFRGLGNIITNAMDFTETENYFSRAMGNMYDKAMLFQNKLTEMYGMSMNTMMNAQATYKNMIGSLGGLSDQMAYDLSETVTKMTLDFSSLYNVDFDKTVAKMQSALSKQVRPIRSVSGYDITQNVLGATAQDLGISRSISEMNELEKRLLIVLTLANQMRNSGAMNDFARTIEQPSNQLRILQEQLIEVGRWIGSVFYGVIGSVLPYINGFVMAIKELIKTFALFVGYTVPDSSGETQTILDSLDASADDINTGLDDVGKNTDKNIKKAKEWKNVLMSFDVANVIPDQSSSDSSGNSSSSSGTGGLTVDPKILDALKNYNYIFDSIHMKAQDIRDRLLEWAGIAQKAINNEIFKPMQNSWDKYGKSTIKNFNDGWENVKVIGAGVFDVVSVKWRPFFQQASNLFFSLMDTGSLAFSTITFIAKDVWNTGGKVFLEGVFDLTTAVLRLAVAINDDFIKPTVKLFKNTLGVVLSKVLGTILNLIGKFMTCLAQLITVFSKNSTAVRILATSFTAMYTAIKLGQLIKLWDSMSKGISITTRLSSLFLNHTKIGSKLYDVYVKSSDSFTMLKYAWSNGITVIGVMFQKLANLTSGCKSYQLAMKSGTFSTEGLTVAQTVCANATKLLNNALNFLSAHPLVAVALAIGTAVVALGAFASSQKSAGKAIEDCSQEIQDEYNEIKDLSSAIDSAEKSARDQIETTDAQISATESYIEKLRKMQDEDGYVKNIETAKILIDDINEVLPETVSITDDGRVVWNKTNDEIEKNIELLKKQARQKAYQDVYVESLKSELQIEQKLNEQKEKLTDLYDQARDSYNSYVKSVEDGTTRLDGPMLTWDQWIESLENGDTALSEQITLVRETEDELNKASNSTEYYSDKIDELADSTDDVTKSTKEMNEETKNAYKNIGKTGQDNIQKVMNSLKEYDKKISETSKKTDENSKKELSSTQKLRTQKLLEYSKMLGEYDLTYDQLINIAESNGLTFTEKEKATLQSIAKIYETQGKQAGINYIASLSNKISENGSIVTGKALNLISSTNSAISRAPLLIGTSVQDFVSQAKQKRKDAQDNVGKISISTILEGDMKEAGRKAGSNYKSGFIEKATATVKSVAKGVTSVIGSLEFFASGGFPDVGQMFIARENGIPELVGSLGGKNAVANNTQIENGIYRAVLQAMRDSGNSRMVGGDLHITIQNADGTKIEKVIKDYNKLMQMTGGKGGFVI